MSTEPDRYEVLDELGKGGMGTVYRAQDLKLRRRVALKRLHPNLARDPLSIGRLQKEASLAATLEHPNIVRIYDVIRDEQGAFITMEYVSGQSLAEHLERQGAMSLYQAQSICQKVGRALCFAHAKGVIHLDVKPTNILMAANGEPRLTDFGIATWTQEQGELTRELLGTPEYAAPEQSMAESRPDARADVYSLAASFYAMLTGTSPRVIRESEIPKPFRALLLKALSQDPARRPASMEAFLDELESIDPHRRTSWPLLAGGVGSLLVIGLVVSLVVKKSTEQDQVHSPSPRVDSAPHVQKPEEPVLRESVQPARAKGTIPPEPKAEAALEALNVVPAGKNAWAYGFVKNTGESPIEKPRVELTFYDPQDVIAGEGFGYAAFEVLEPGMRAPVSVVVKGYTKQHARHAAKVDARKLYVSHKRLARLSIHEEKLVKGEFGASTFSARIRNDDSLPVKYARAVVVFYDQQDRIIAVSSGYAVRKELAVGEDSRVDVRVYTPSRQAPARYEVFASAAVYQK